MQGHSFATCVHEAGHAVVHVVLNRGQQRGQRYVANVTVDRARITTDGALGETLVAFRRGRMVWQDAVPCLAGAAAECRLAHGPDWRPSHTQLEAARTAIATARDVRMAMDAVAEVGDPEATLRLLWQAAGHLVRSKWGPIVRVAWQLQHCGSLTGAQVEEMVRRPHAIDAARYPEWKLPARRARR